MSLIETISKTWQFNRSRTLALLELIEKEANPAAVLAWRPGPGRAHIGWQLMHIGVTEDIFGSERLAPGSPGRWSTIWPRFRGGSKPDDDVPAPARIREVLETSRAALLETVAGISESRLDETPETLKDRGWRIRDVLYIINWHEAHHQGQAHLTYNLNKASRGV